jgi:hypothetical protein
MEAPPELGEMGRTRVGQATGEVRKCGGRGGRQADDTAARSPPAAGGVGGGDGEREGRKVKSGSKTTREEDDPRGRRHWIMLVTIMLHVTCS